jgi:tetratricopeptide (TPR) repeat protein
MPARSLPREKLTPADDLRELLRQCELQVVALKSSGAKVVSFLQLMDRAHSLFHELEAKGIDLRAEQSRWETIGRQVDSYAPVLVKEVRAAGGLAQLRVAEEPTSDRWWWFLDEKVRSRRQQSLRQALVGGGIVLAILVIAGLLYQRFLAPDPLTRQAFQLDQRAERAIQEGDLETALVEYEALHELTPDAPEVILRLGALYEILGRDKDADQAYARARELLNNQESFFTERGMIYLELNQLESALADAKAALTQNPESTLGYLLIGSVYEAQGQIPEAMDALQQAADLALAQENDTLYALIKFRLGVLMGGSGGIGP